MKQELEKMKCELIDHIDRALVSKSDQIPNSWSSVVFGFTKKLDDHIQLNEKRWERIEPYIKKAEDDREFREGLEARGKTVGVWAGIWLAVAGVIASIYYGLKHIK